MYDRKTWQLCISSGIFMTKPSSKSSKPKPLSGEAFSALVRDDGDDASAYLDTLEVESIIDGTQTLVRWHRICHDVTLDKPDTEKLLDKLFKLLIDFACTRKELADALASPVPGKPPSGQAFSALQEKARGLFTTSSTTGEVGELLLYFLAEHLLKYPQVLCKFSLKTNPNVHAHGADGVHASVDPSTQHLRLHWGEAKLYQKLGNAVNDCCESLSELILQPPGAKKSKKRDIELFRDFIKLENPALEMAIRAYLDPDKPLSNKVRFCGLAVIGFDLEDYDALTKEVAQKETTAIAARTAKWAKKFKKSVEDYKLTGITIDAFCIPFPSVQDFRDAFLKRLG